MDKDEDRQTITGEYPEKLERCDFCFQPFPVSKLSLVDTEPPVLACNLCKQMYSLAGL